MTRARALSPIPAAIQGCIEQEFDFPGLVEVRNNRVFKTEFLLNLQTIHASLGSRLANPFAGYDLSRALSLRRTRTN